jgi:hypothetical protein
MREYTDEKIAVVAPMQRASVRSVVAVMRFDFQSSRAAWRTSVSEPAKMPADVGSELGCEDVIVE